MNDTATIIGRIEKNCREEIRVSLDSWKGFNLVALRVFYRDDAGAMKPSKAGLVFRVEKLPQVLAALQEAQAEARRRGLLGGEVVDALGASP